MRRAATAVLASASAVSTPTRLEFTHDFVGTELAFFCKHDVYEGKTNEKWQVSRGSGASAGEAMDDKEMRQLDALFGKRLKETKPVAQSRKPADSVPAKNNAIRPRQWPHKPLWAMGLLRGMKTKPAGKSLDEFDIPF